MISRTPLMTVFFALSAVTFSMAFASSQPQISLINVGNSEFDLAWEPEDRIFRVWTEFSNFNPNDGSFFMKIIQSETGEIVSKSTINVMTNSQNSSIDFNSFVLYAINSDDICQNEEFDSLTMSFEECDPLTGQYEMIVSTNDGLIIKSTSFIIIDSRI